jgi:hypothetical protein
MSGEFELHGMRSTLRPQHTTLAQINAYLQQRYARGRVIVRERSDFIVIFEIDQLRDEILVGAHRWERLQVTVACVNDERTRLLLLTIDATYAPGIGKSPPPLASYRDLETEHSAELESYTAALATKLQELGKSGLL